MGAKKGIGTSVTYTYADGSTATLNGVYAFIDNNPGNQIAGPGIIGKNGGFVIFSSPQAGWDALLNDVSKFAAAGTDILGMIEIRTPKDDGKNPMLKGNNPEKYARDLAATLGVQTTTKVSALTADQLTRLAIAIGQREGYFAAGNSATTKAK